MNVCAAVGTARSIAAMNSDERVVLCMVEKKGRRIGGRAVARVWSGSDSDGPANTDSYCNDRDVQQ